jgi:hypothetical protein
VVDTASDTPEQFLRDLVVRGMPVVAVNREPKSYSMHSVLVDTTLGVSRLGRDLVLAGHRKFAAVEPKGSSAIAQALQQSTARYASDVSVDSCSPDEIATLADHGVSGIVCGSTREAQEVKAHLERARIRIPEQISLTAAGCGEESIPCSGYFCSHRQIVDAVVQLLKNAPAGRPAALWLAGEFIDRSTIGATGILGPIEQLANVRVGGMMV